MILSEESWLRVVNSAVAAANPPAGILTKIAIIAAKWLTAVR